MAKRRGRPRPEIDEDPQESDLERFSGVTRDCPECGAELYDEADVCWKCGHALGATGDAKGPARWVVVTVVVLIGLMVAWLVVR